MEVREFRDGNCRCVVWDLPDTGWADWAACADRFLAHAVRATAAEYEGGAVAWLEVNHWPISGRLIVFPSADGPGGGRDERVSFELSARHLEAEAGRVGRSVPEADRGAAWEGLARRVWSRVAECFAAGEAGRELAVARRGGHPMRVAGYDYEPGEGPPRLTGDGLHA